jgi:hypothetical protein
MGTLAKQISELVVLCASILALMWINTKIDRRDISYKYPLNRRRALLVIVGFGILVIAASQLNVPSRLSITDSEVIQAKNFNRAACRAALAVGDVSAAEQHTRNNAVSKARAQVSAIKQRPTLDNWVRKLANPVSSYMHNITPILHHNPSWVHLFDVLLCPSGVGILWCWLYDCSSTIFTIINCSFLISIASFTHGSLGTCITYDQCMYGSYIGGSYMVSFYS